MNGRCLDGGNGDAGGGGRGLGGGMVVVVTLEVVVVMEALSAEKVSVVATAVVSEEVDGDANGDGASTVHGLQLPSIWTEIYKKDN